MLGWYLRFDSVPAVGFPLQDRFDSAPAPVFPPQEKLQVLQNFY